MFSSSALEILDDNEPLNPKILELWIKRKKKASARDIPPDVTAYLAQTRIVMEAAIKLLPHQDLPVLDFTNFQLPTVREELAQNKASSWFTEKPVNCHDPSIVFNQFVPPKSFVQSLLQVQDQAVLDGCLSFTIPKFPDQQLPLYIPTFLELIHKTLQGQSDWKNSMDWLDRQTEENADEEVSLAKQIIHCLPWNARLDLTFSSTYSTTLSFSRFLSERWMCSSLMDLMLGQLADHLEGDEKLDSTIVLEPLRFMEYLEQPEKHQSALCRISWQLEKKTMVLFVSHWQKQRHWVAFKTIIKHGSVTYADGIEDNPRPEELLNRLTNWFGEQFGRMFKAPNPGNLLRHGLQNDFYNCGLVAINAIEHELWQRELWTTGTKVQHRARWFNELSQAFFKQAGRTPPMDFHSIGIMEVSNLLNPPLETIPSKIHVPHDTRLEISSLIHGTPWIENSSSISRKHSRSPSSESTSINRAAAEQQISLLPSFNDDSEASDFLISDDKDDTDSVATVNTDDEFYASSKGNGVSRSAAWT
ncbi:hypothetical protein C8R41DRAFT_925853 [Lentinula lateritia]|uniref:Ubiquitin-like protease family profile domain-containing protein n=1 Tax=Lentinula lateritia TaxID=40482 RepID=A0ABQ8V104_9AGAR|nr:hypothetical protein C8R41DRAFT_925853 [Lentinula lateritia]